MSVVNFGPVALSEALCNAGATVDGGFVKG
jgi:hypothetical protein